MKKVLSTKTLNEETLTYAQSENLEVQCVDFIETTAFPFKFQHLGNKQFDALAFTSASAVKYFFENKDAIHYIQGKQVFAIAGKTQDELMAKGIKADVTGASAEELGNAIANKGTAKTVLHICGNLRLPVLENKLSQAGIFYTDLMVYQTGTKAKKIADGFDAILFYSPSGIESFLSLNNISNETVCCCIGQTTAQALRDKRNSASIILPKEASPQSMLDSVAGYFNNSAEAYKNFRYHHQS